MSLRVMAEGDAPVVQGVVQPGLPDDIGLGPRHLGGDELRRGQSAGIEVLLVHLQPHAGELVLQLPGSLAAVVGQKQKFLFLPVQPLHKLLGAGQQTVPVIDHAVHIIDHAVHITDIAALVAKLIHKLTPLSAERYLRAVSHYTGVLERKQGRVCKHYRPRARSARSIPWAKARWPR